MPHTNWGHLNHVTLTRTGAIAETINGVLKFYGAATSAGGAESSWT